MGVSKVQQVRIVTDTVAQLIEEVTQRYSVTVVPAATIHCDGRIFTDGVDITPSEAYQLLAQNPKMFTTAAIPQHYYGEAFESLSSDVNQIFCTTVSSKLSAGYDAALRAAKELTKDKPNLRIEVFDSLNAAGGEGLIALAAARAAAEGLDLDAVIKAAEKARENAECLFVFDTLAEIYRSGRIPKVAALAANALSVKPMFSINRDGKVHFAGLARSRKKGVKRIIEITREIAGNHPIDVIVEHTSIPEDAEKLKSQVEEEFNCREIFVSEFSPVMGYAIGPGLLGIAFCPVPDTLII